MEEVIAGRARVAFNGAGGLHHAMRRRASGFCIYNDPAIVCGLLADRGMKVAYVDIDAHHGDGVQAAFYETDQVLTVSLHETGRTLFPGTGFADERGTGKGAGYSVNVALPPYTDDPAYVRAFDAVVPPLVARFRPDVLVTQQGIDARASARGAVVRVDALSLGRDGRRRIRPRRGAPHVVDGVPAHARRADSAGAPRPAPTALERQRQDRGRRRDR